VSTNQATFLHCFLLVFFYWAFHTLSVWQYIRRSVLHPHNPIGWRVWLTHVGPIQ
jgi:hypothetical protein